MSLRRGMDHQHRTFRAGGEAFAGLLLVEIKAPVPGRDRDPGAESEELRSLDLGSLPMENLRRVPALAGGAQRVLGLVVARHEHGRYRNRLERVDRLLETLVDGGEVAGGDHYVRLRGTVNQAAGLVEVAMQVAEREQPHGSAVCHGAAVAEFRRGSARASSRGMYGAFSGISFGLVALVTLMVIALAFFAS